MVEIARAFSVTDTPVRLVILDEPTSSLDARRRRTASRLRPPLRRRAAARCILISHLLGEILSTVDRIVVMRDGRSSRNGRPPELHARFAGGGDGQASREARTPERAAAASKRQRRRAARARPAAGAATAASSSPIAARSSASPASPARARPRCCARLFDAARGARATPRSTDRVALVAGDRQTDGIFPLWSIAKNISVGSLRDACSRGLLIDRRREAEMAETWRERIDIRTPDVRQQHPVALRRQPAEGAVRARARLEAPTSC